MIQLSLMFGWRKDTAGYSEASPLGQSSFKTWRHFKWYSFILERSFPKRDNYLQRFALTLLEEGAKKKQRWVSVWIIARESSGKICCACVSSSFPLSPTSIGLESCRFYPITSSWLWNLRSSLQPDKWLEGRERRNELYFLKVLSAFTFILPFRI